MNAPRILDCILKIGNFKLMKQLLFILVCTISNEVLRMNAFSYEINRDGIAVLTFDLPGEKVNKLTTPVMQELDALLDDLASKKEIKALVFRSGKEGSFIVGADIAEIRGITDAATAERL